MVVIDGLFGSQARAVDDALPRDFNSHSGH